MTTPIAQGPVDVNVRRPRLRVIQQSRNTYLGRYKEHVVEVCKERNDKNWYIVVTGPSGCYCYHGWWRDSTNKTKREAVLEALQGAMLWTPNALANAPASTGD